MNDTAASTFTLLFLAGAAYGCYKLIVTQDEKFERKEMEDKALFERFVVAVEASVKSKGATK
jgi:hypothetical protein